MPPNIDYPAYTPPQYLLAGTGLSQDELIALYQGFYGSLQDARATPELVFERLVGNLMGVSGAALSRERADHVAAEEAWDLKKADLESDLVRAVGFIRNYEIARRASRAREVVPSPAPVYQMYIQFWFKAPNHVRATTTNIPVPYGIGYGWTEIEHCISSGKYDSREDPQVTTATLPTEFVRYIHFQKPPESPPQVLVWLTGLSAVAGGKVSVAVRARGITETGFELEIRSHGGVPVGSVGAAWAFSEAKGEGEHPTLVVDTYCSEPYRKTPMLTHTSILCRRGPLSSVGFTAISALHLALEERGWIEMTVNMEKHNGLSERPTVRIQAGPVESKVYSVGLQC